MAIFELSRMQIDASRYPWGYRPLQYALSFAADNSYVESIDNVGIQGNEEREVQLSIKGAATSTRSAIFMWAGSDGQRDAFSLIFENNTLRVESFYDGFDTGWTPPRNDIFYHIKVTFINEVLGISINNGEELDYVNNIGSLNTVDSPLRICRYWQYGVDDRFWNGQVKELFIWDYNGVLKIGYNMQEGSGDVLNDISGNNNYGTIYGATWVEI